jgi:hypothetical protein
MSELRITEFWCQECGQPLAVCDGEGVCTEARKRSIMTLGDVFGSVLPFLFVKIDTLPFTVAMQKHLENEAIKEMNIQEEKIRQLKGEKQNGKVQSW